MLDNERNKETPQNEEQVSSPIVLITNSPDFSSYTCCTSRTGGVSLNVAPPLPALHISETDLIHLLLHSALALCGDLISKLSLSL